MKSGGNNTYRYRKTVYVLGAGMSKDLGAPLIADFMNSLLEYVPISQTRRLRTFLVKRYSSISKAKKANIETILSDLDNAISEGKLLVGYNIPMLRIIRHELVMGIASTLDRVHYKVLEDLYSYNRYEDPYYYEARDFKLLRRFKTNSGKLTEKERYAIQRERTNLRVGRTLHDIRYEYRELLKELVSMDSIQASNKVSANKKSAKFHRIHHVLNYLETAVMSIGLARFREWFLKFHPLYPFLLHENGFVGDHPTLKVRARGWDRKLAEDFIKWLMWLSKEEMLTKRSRKGLDAVVHLVSKQQDAAVEEYMTLTDTLYSELIEHDAWVRVQARHLLQGKINSYMLLMGVLCRNDSIISLNYDLFPEMAIDSLIDDDVGVDYGLDVLSSFTPWGEHGQPFSRYSHGNRPITILKLHGSINWLQCSVCAHVYYTFNTPANTPGVSYAMKRCAQFMWEEYMMHPCCYQFKPTRTEIPLIPPTLEKNMNVGFLAKIWEKARYEIACATELIFIGYSLSESDMHIRKLIKDAILLRRSGNADYYCLNQRMNVAGGELSRSKEKVMTSDVIEKTPPIELSKMPLRVRVVCGKDESGKIRKRYKDFFDGLGVNVETIPLRATEYLTGEFLKRMPDEVVFS